MQLINGVPKYLYHARDGCIITYSIMDEYAYMYFTDTDNAKYNWGALRDYTDYYGQGKLEPLQLKHLFHIQSLEGHRKIFVIAFINDLIADIKDRHK